MDAPKMLRAIRFTQGPMVHNGRTSLVLGLEDQDGKQYYTLFMAKNNYVDGILKSISRLNPVQFTANNIPTSYTVGTAGQSPDDGEIMVKHSTGIKQGSAEG